MEARHTIIVAVTRRAYQGRHFQDDAPLTRIAHMTDGMTRQVSGRSDALHARPLFVTGCQRSGTTAFTEYLNHHPEILVGVERYGRVSAKEITPEMFTFERILDYSAEDSLRPREYYVDLLSKKDPERLKWIGDKFPGYAKWLRPLSENNPGAYFIILYRPIEEVAESWEARSKNPDDPWLGGKNGFELGVQMWNNIQQKTRKFVESGLGTGVLIVSYHDFFYHNEDCVPLLSRFLGIEFDDDVREAWREMSAEFEQKRRPKKHLTDEQRAYIRAEKDSVAEEWVLARIDRQWRDLESYLNEEKTLVQVAEAEPRKLVDILLKVGTEAREQGARARLLEQRVRRLEKQNRLLILQKRDLEEQIRVVQNSRTHRLMGYLGSLRAKISARR